MKMKSKWIAALLIFAATAATGYAQEFPTRNIEYIVPTLAGGGTDLCSRAIAEFASKKLGQAILAVNKPGGGTAVGLVYAMKQAKADGYTVFAETPTASSMMVAGMVTPPVVLEDRVFAGRMIVDPMAYAVKADAPWKTFKEFSAWAKANPDKLTWASLGPSSLSAFAIQDWLAAIGADESKTRMVPSAGAVDSLTKVAGGHVVLASHSVAECMTLHQAGKVRILAIQSDKRSKYMPGVPTAVEEGVKGLSVKYWTGVSIRKGTPEPVLKKWEKVLAEIGDDPEFKKKVENIHMEVGFLNNEKFQKLVSDEAKFYTELAKRIGIRK